MNTQ
jgi:hypothetical protein